MRADPNRPRQEGQAERREARRQLYEQMLEADQPRYVISVAAQILGVHPQTLRLYEREGLVEPNRTGGKIRLYSERDIEKVRCVMRLTNDLGVNLAGAEALLNMRDRMVAMQQEMERMRREMDMVMEKVREELDLEL